MIINHKKAFQYVLKNSDIHKAMKTSLIEDIHSILIKDLRVNPGLRNKFVDMLESKTTLNEVTL